MENTGEKNSNNSNSNSGMLSMNSIGNSISNSIGSIGNSIGSMGNSMSNSMSNSMGSTRTASETSIRPSDSGSEGSFFSRFNTITWVLIGFVFIFILFNIITIFSPGITNITSFMDNIFKKLFGGVLAIFGKLIYGTAEVSKDVIGGTADVIDTGLTEIQNNLKDVSANKSNSSLSSQPVQTQPQQTTSQQSNINVTNNQTTQADYQASEAQSTINNTGQTAWCYVGQEQGVRTCVKVGENDTCMSGDIFPSSDLCINPNLRQ